MVGEKINPVTSLSFYGFLGQLIHSLIIPLSPLLPGCGVEAAIFVQCLNNCPEEINWVEEQAKEFRVIKGIVGGIDLTQVDYIIGD